MQISEDVREVDVSSDAFKIQVIPRIKDAVDSRAIAAGIDSEIDKFAIERELREQRAARRHHQSSGDHYSKTAVKKQYEQRIVF